MSRPISEKMFLKPGMRTYPVGTPDWFLDHIDAPDLEVMSQPEGEFVYVHVFAKDQFELDRYFSELKPLLARNGALWVSWPKGGGMGTDLSLHEVVVVGYRHGLVESICLSIDQTWSGFRFTHPKPGKIYQNSHAKLIRN